MPSDYETALAAYQRDEFSHGPWTRTVYRRGLGPAVIVIHEMPGLHPLVIRFADRVAEAGLTVFMPVLFGTLGRPVSLPYMCRSMIGAACIRREFNIWSRGKSSLIVDWLRALAHKAHRECGGRGVGAVGMCFTGGFALAMMTEPSVVAPVLSQPSLPFAVGAQRSAGIDASPAEVACAKQRMIDEDLSMIGLRVKSDKMVPDARCVAYRKTFEERFEAIELEDADAAPTPWWQPPHSVLTVHKQEQGPTKAAEQRVIAFLCERTAAPLRS